MGNVSIKIINPNSHYQLEEALSDMIAYELANREIEKEDNCEINDDLVKV